MALTAVDLSQASKRVTPTLAHDVVLGDLAQSVGNRAGVASLTAIKSLVGGFAPVTLGAATVSAQVTTWRSTNISIPAAGLWFLLRVDLPVHRGLYLLNGDQWRTLSVGAAGGNPTEAQTIPPGWRVFLRYALFLTRRTCRWGYAVGLL